jgi:hypothetical protein
MRRAGLLAALAWAAAPLRAAPPEEPPKPAASAPAPAEYALREGRFALRPPQGWSASRDAREDARQKVYGVLLSGPRSADGVLSTISMAYYPPGNALFKGGAAEFLKRNLTADPRFVAPAGETTSPVEKTVVGGLPSRRFTRRAHEYLPPGRMDGKAVAIVERVDVVDAKAGFYVLEFKSSALLDEKLEPAFAGVRSSVRFTDAPAPKP